MSKISKKYEGEFIVLPTCPAGEVVIKDIEAGKKIGRSKINDNKYMNRYPVYIDEPKPDNVYAYVKSIYDDAGNELTGDAFEDFIRQELNITPTSVEKSGMTLIKAEITIAKLKSTSSMNTGDIPEDIQQMADKKVEEGILTKEEADKKLKVMMDNYVSLNIIRRVVCKWKTYSKASHKLRTLYIDPYLEEKRKNGELGLIATELSNAVDGYAVIMQGEKSVGKNVFVETIAWLLNMPLYMITFSRNMSPSSVYGEKSTDNSASEYFKTEMAQKAAQAKQNLADIENALTEMRKLYIDTAECQIAYTDKLYADAYNELVRECVESNDFSPLLMKNGHIAVARKLGKLKENENLYKAISELEEKRDTMKKEIAELELKSAQAQSVNIVIDSSELYDWLTIGGLMVFNEMNMAEANFLASFTNPLTDGTGFLFIPGRGEVPINPDCVLCATQNEDYEGVEQQNVATMSRFGCINFQTPKTIKAQLREAVKTELRNHGFNEDIKIDESVLRDVEDMYKKTRESKEEDLITEAALNIRGYVRALAQYIENDGSMSLKTAVETHVVNTCPIDDRKIVSGCMNDFKTQTL